MRVLVFAPHRDDEVLGVGGTIRKHVLRGDEVYVCEFTDVQKQPQLLQCIKNEEYNAHQILGVKESYHLSLPVVELPLTPIKERNYSVQRVVNDVKPNIAYIPHYGDMHLDHRIVAECAMVALRPPANMQLQAIYSYETLSETEWNTPNVKNVFIPNVWSNITDTIETKIEAMKCFQSQLMEFPHPRSIEAIKNLAQYRGAAVGFQFAESFMLVRQLCDWGNVVCV